MLDATELLRAVYKESFTIEKLRADLISYLRDFSARNEIKKISEDEYMLDAYNEIAEQTEHVIVSVNDEITPIIYRSSLEFNDFYYQVVIGLGNFVENKDGIYFFEVEKCMAKMKFNYDLSLYDIEFYVSEFNKIR
ncbi:MAG TPA: hypothetical protein VFO93_05100 [Hymenobacter sp.]|uniref:hypothetical protein n=1 Tax=Hymenobacter sp. TaxID=1898978 RepID=UPI002D7EA2D3|nr:hypothetical protein [Hymenobacter sp.]HET9502895.1 hypothetical protein [Hymenobacter sp.]